MSKSKEIPIFGKQRVNFTPNYPLTHLCVANNHVVLAMQNNVILKINLENPDKREEIDLKAHSIDAKVLNLYLDPSGEHLLIGFSPKDEKNPAQVMYLPPNSSKPKDIPKLNGQIVTAVGWNPSLEFCTKGSTNPFLLGTTKGLIFEADIANDEVRVSKPLYDIGKGGSGSSGTIISGLEYFFIPRTNKIFVLVATSRKLYQFKGFVNSRDERPWFGSIFSNYLSQTGTEEMLEFGDTENSGSSFGYGGGGSSSRGSDPNHPHQATTTICRLNIVFDSGTGYPKSIGYLADGDSLVFNDVMTVSGSTALDNFLKDTKRIKYPGSIAPRALVLTDYHVLFLYKDTIKALCTLNEEVIFDDSFDPGRGKVIGMTRDPIKGTIWTFTERAVLKYVVKAEDRNVWKIYLEKGNFTKAQEASRGDSEKMEQITIKQAEYYFNKKEYEKSAMYYALTKTTFEEIALKFVQIDDSGALKTFLMKKLSSLRPPYDLTKVSMLVLWIIELYQNELGTLRDFGKRDTAEYHNLDEEFLQFMAQNIVKDSVAKNKKVVYDLMASHGDKENLIHFTLIMKDFDEVIESNISSGNYKNALNTLQKQKDRNLYSRFIPILLDKDPSATIDSLISAGSLLNPIKLLPKFSSKLDKVTAQEITRYLEHCTNTLHINDQPVHDYLLSLYVHYYPVQKLIEYLELQGNDVNRVRYDPKYALNLCLEKKLYNPTIHLYTILGLYEESVALAIQIDLDLAKRTADAPENDEELRKKLWLRIARHVVKEKNDIQQAMNFLQQCELLKIEDILPFFPNFVTIDHFKEAICSSLQEYNKHIQDLKDEMEEATKSAEIIREEIGAVRNRCVVVRANDKCALCTNVQLLIKGFHVFPCGHQFHTDCLLKEIVPLLSEPRKKLLMELQRKLQDVNIRQESLSNGSDVISKRDQIKADIDDIIAPECLYCGDHMIRLIDTPFIPEDDYDRVKNDWE